MSVFDIEADGLRPTKIHCLSYNDADGKMVSLTTYKDMRTFFTQTDTLIGHNIVRYDIPVCERILGIKIKPKIIVDTLALSWYIYIDKLIHGLDDWGKHFGIEKPPIDDWDNLPIEEYVHRCEEDVKINQRLWDMQLGHLRRLYKSDEEVDRLVAYLTFKMQCAASQEASGWRLDVSRCESGLDTLRREKFEKMEQLKAVMPETPTKSKRSKPKKMYLQSGELTKLGVKWVELLEEHRLHPEHVDDVEVITGYKEPNPQSVPQLKDWLYSLGWIPNEFKHNRHKVTGDIKKIPQINKQGADEVGVTESVKKLYPKEPELEALDGLSILTHRIGILNGFLRDMDENGYIQAKISGLTNTLRFKHKVVVNLPGVHKPYGELIRGCLIAPFGYELCGSDMSSLEDRTKQHYMWDFDPDYVKDMQSADFDPHLDIGKFAKMMTDEQVAAYRLDKSFSNLRHSAKQANYSCTYGATPQRLVWDSGLTLTTATTLYNAYWKRNWSLKAIADACTVKQVNGTKWLYNSVSGFWHSLRYDKDRFSTLNQSTGVYCFDTWIKHVLSVRPQLTAQMHDEIVLCLKEGSREKCDRLLKWAIDETNKELKLNVQLDVSIDYGNAYSEIH